MRAGLTRVTLSTWLYRLVYMFAWVVTRFVARYHVTGREHVPQTGSLLIISNHLSWYDPLLLGLACRRRIWFYTKGEMFTWPIIGWLCRTTGQIPVHRGEADRTALMRALDYLAENKAVVVFPEGTVERQEVMIQAHTGVALLALRSGATVLPVAILGSRRIMRKGRGWFPRVQVTIGMPYKPILPEGMPRKAGLQQITDDVMKRIAEMLPLEQRGVYQQQLAQKQLEKSSNDSSH